MWTVLVHSTKVYKGVELFLHTFLFLVLNVGVFWASLFCSKIFRTGAAIYTTVVVARSTGPNRPNCEFGVLLRRFAATAWERAKTSPRTLPRTHLAASPWQRPVSHFRLHPAVYGEMLKGCHPPPKVLPWFGTLWLLPISTKKLKLKGRRFDTKEEIQAESQRVLDTVAEKGLQEVFQKWRRRWNWCLHARGNYFVGDGGRYALWWVVWILQHPSGIFLILPHLSTLSLNLNSARQEKHFLDNCITSSFSYTEFTYLLIWVLWPLPGCAWLLHVWSTTGWYEPRCSQVVTDRKRRSAPKCSKLST
jgi:hypothetical protein